MSPHRLDLRDLAERYTAAWCGQNPALVAAFYSDEGSLCVNDDPPAVGREAIPNWRAPLYLCSLICA